ncbi:MAG: PaaI family thioesterase [Bacteroidales bacterium]
MKRKLNNPFTKHPEHKCFCCSTHNPIGLNLTFWHNEEEQSVETMWLPHEFYQGYPSVLHGGIQSTLMDEVASWSIYMLLKTAGVTAKLDVSFRKPVIITKGKVTVIGKLVNVEKKIATIHTSLLDGDGTLCSEATIKYFIYPQEKAIKELNYPGFDAF